MSTYIYKAKKGPAEIVNGEIEADSQDKAVGKVEALGLVPVRVEEKELSKAVSGPVNPVQPAANLFRGKIKAKDVDIFTRQLSSLIKAKVSILRALSLVSCQTEDRNLKSLVKDLTQRVREGKILSEALAGYPKVFNNLYLNIIKSGEKGGNLDEALIRLTEHRAKEREIQQKIQAALAYPMLLIVVGIGTIFIMFTYFLPKLMVVFKNMKQVLPLPTRILIGLSDFLAGNWFWFLIVFIFLAVVFARVKPGSKKKFFFDSLKLKVPFIRNFVRNGEIVKFCRTLSLLLKNGIPVYESLELATGTLDNEALKESLNRANKEIVVQGSTLSQSLKKISLLPQFVLNMVAVGEEGGRLEESLAEVASSYEKELEQAIKVMSSLLEPLLILSVGAVVGFIVFAMLLPIFDIGVIGK